MLSLVCLFFVSSRLRQIQTFRVICLALCFFVSSRKLMHFKLPEHSIDTFVHDEDAVHEMNNPMYEVDEVKNKALDEIPSFSFGLGTVE